MKDLNHKSCLTQPIGVTLGNFDGLHVGHRQLIEQSIMKARQKNIPAAVLTFNPHPEAFFHDNMTGPILPRHCKKKILQDMGLDYYIELPFDISMGNMEARDFVENILLKQFNVVHIAVGHDYRFGKKKQGNTSLLDAWQKPLAYDLYVQPEITDAGLRVSSTAIREFIRRGEVLKAAKMLGYFPVAEGDVVHGNSLGKKLGFPTANISLKEHLLVPQKGVYLGHACINKSIYHALISVGYKPTIGDNYDQNIEAHIFDFDLDLYGATIQLSFTERIRNEIKFDTVDALVTQLIADREYAIAHRQEKMTDIALFPHLLY